MEIIKLKIEKCLDLFKNKIKPREEIILDLDEDFHPVKTWIEKESQVHEFFDIFNLYGSYGKLLGLEEAKKRLLKANQITENELNELMEDTLTLFKRSTPTNINGAISDYLAARISIKQKRS